MPKILAKIKLPCKARNIEDEIRKCCEHDGLYDTAVVSVVRMKDPHSYDDVNYLVISNLNKSCFVNDFRPHGVDGLTER